MFDKMFDKCVTHPGSDHNGNPEDALSSHQLGRQPFNYGSDVHADYDGGGNYYNIDYHPKWFISALRCDLLSL